MKTFNSLKNLILLTAVSILLINCSSNSDSKRKKRNVGSVTVFINNITFLDNNQVIFTGSFANCHARDEYYDTFNFSIYFKNENLKSFFKSSTVYADNIMDASEI